MTKQHYEELARWCAKWELPEEIVVDLCDILKTENERFSKDLFLAAIKHLEGKNASE